MFELWWWKFLRWLRRRDLFWFINLNFYAMLGIGKLFSSWSKAKTMAAMYRNHIDSISL